MTKAIDDALEGLIGKIHAADARDFLKRIPNESIDLCLTDPPYFDGVFFEIEDELYRVMKKDSWLVFWWGTKTLPEPFRRFHKFEYVWTLVAEHPTPTRKTVVGDNTFALILVFRKGKPKVCYRRWDRLPSGDHPLLQTRPKDPEFKPTLANCFILQMFSRPGDLVLDPFAGLGSIPVACQLMGRRWIAIEIDKRKARNANKLIRYTKTVIPRRRKIKQKTH